MFWEETSRNVGVKRALFVRKPKINFQVAVTMNYTFSADGEDQQISPNEVDRELYVENNFKSHVEREEHTQLISIYPLYQVFIILIFLFRKSCR